ncbi:MAG: D-alanine--D-alanine ligase [Planctomycetota bacterium]|nr:D-alanine--D-alanine ligase [Planctomycetota bacterium]
MKKLRVLALVHDDLVPPDSIEGLTDEEMADWRAEYDVISACEDLGHDVMTLGIGDDVDVIRRATQEFEPHVCFNLLVEFHGAGHYDQHVVSYLELLEQDYTGCNPRGMTLARDKGLSKTIVARHGVRVPDFDVFLKNRKIRRRPDLKFPLFVKSVDEEASLGISLASIVRDDDRLAERVTFVHERVGTDAIAEEYVDGREFYVGVLGNDRLKTFPPWELLIPNLPEGAPRIATRRLKWDLAYQRRIGVKNRRAELPEAVEEELGRIARGVYRQLSLSGYARLDFRMRPDGRIYLLEANPNPDITFGEDFADSAEAGGMGYEELLQRILQLGLAYPAAWKGNH